MRIFILGLLVFASTVLSPVSSAAKVTTRASDSLALLELYEHTNGPGWRFNAGWLSEAPIEQWFGVKTALIVNEGDTLKVVVELHNSSSDAGGTLPDLNLPNLERLELTFMRLTGDIPNFNLPRLKFLSLSGNKFDGTIPAFNLPELETLVLNHNPLRGTIPDFNLPNLRTLAITGGDLEGPIPNFKMPRLQGLLLSSNQLSGAIPHFDFPELTVLDLDHNWLSGSIPAFSFPLLERLNLNNNLLVGDIPQFDCPNLNRLSLNDNQLSGSLLESYAASLRSLSMHNNKLVFKHLERYTDIQAFNYHSQDTLLPVAALELAGDTVFVLGGVASDGNEYQWERLENKRWESVPAAVEKEFKPVRNGKYRCKVTNPLLPNLRLYSTESAIESITVDVAEYSLTGDLITALIVPSPLSDFASLQFGLRRPAQVKLTLYNLHGETVLTLVDDYYEGGDYSIPLDVRTLAPGRYSFLLRTERSSRELPVIVTR